MPKASACLVPGDLQKLVSGHTKPAEKDGFLSHLESCDDCARRLATLPGSDTLVDLVREAQTLSEDPAQARITNLIERMRTLGPAQRTTPPEEQTLPPRDAAPTGGILVIACPGCEKSLKVKSELAGKKVKCPQCGKAVPIPKPEAPRVDDGATLAPDAGRAPSFSQGQQTAAIDDGPPPCPEEVYDFLAPAQQPGELGRLGPYRVLKVLGAGGMGVVFQAEDPQLGRLVALKAMLPALAASPSAKQRFLREAKAAAAIKHDHIVTIHQVGEDRGAPFLAMEFLEGQPLDKRLEEAGKLPIAEVLRIGREMAEGLEAAHERGLIHRDIKPGNVWLEGRRARVKILDFGLARAASEESQLTQQGAIIGTPAFMAPEQAAGRTVDKRCDLFSFGCVLYRLTTGELPFKGTDTISTLMAVSTEEPPSPSVKNPAVPRALADLIMQLLAKKADDRPESAQAVADALAGMEKLDRTQVDDHLGATSRTIQSGDGRRTPKSRRKVALIAGVLALAAAIVAAVVIMRVQAPGGEFILEVDDDQVAVAIDKQGGLKLIDKKTGREFLVKARQTAALPAGEYELAITDPKAGMEFSARTFSIKGADQATRVKVWFKGSAGVASAFDALKRENIPAEALKAAGDGDAGKAPQDLVGVFGTANDKSAVIALTVAPDGRRVLGLVRSGSSPSLLTSWDAATGKQVFVEGKPKPTSSHARFSRDGRRLFRGGSSIAMVDTATGLELLTFAEGKVYNSSVLAVSPDGKRLATTWYDGKTKSSDVRIWDTAGGVLLLTIKDAQPVGSITTMVYSPDGKKLALGAHDLKRENWRVRIINADDGTELVKIPGCSWPLDFSPDNAHIALGFEGEVAVHDASTGMKLKSMPARQQFRGVYSPDGKRLATTWEGASAVWDPSTGAKLRQWNVKQRGFEVAFSLDGRYLLRGISDGTVHVFRLGDAAAQPSNEPATPVAGNPFDQLRRENIPADALKTAGDGDPAAAPKQLVAVFGEPSDKLKVRLLQVTPDSKRIVAAAFASSASASLISWESATGKRLLHSKPFSSRMTGHFSPDASRFYCGHYTINVYDTTTGQTMLTFGQKGELGGGSRFAVSLNGKRLATSGSSKSLAAVQIWDTDGGRALFRIKDIKADVNSLALSPDGKRLAMGLDSDDEQSRVRIVSTEDGKEIVTIADGRQALAFSPDGSRLVVGEYKSATIRDAHTGAKILSLGGMSQAAYSLDGKRLASSTVRGIAVWDSDTGQQLFQWNLSKGRGIAFAPDGRHLLVGNPDGTVYVVRLADAAVKDRAGSGK